MIILWSNFDDFLCFLIKFWWFFVFFNEKSHFLMKFWWFLVFFDQNPSENPKMDPGFCKTRKNAKNDAAKLTPIFSIFHFSRGSPGKFSLFWPDFDDFWRFFDHFLQKWRFSPPFLIFSCFLIIFGPQNRPKPGFWSIFDDF